MTGINGFNYLYDAQGNTIAVKKGTQAANDLDSASTSTSADGEWIVLDPSEINNAKSINDFSVEDIISIFMRGDLTLDELRAGLENYGISAIIDEDSYSNKVEVRFRYNNKSYNCTCIKERCQSQLNTEYDTLQAAITAVPAKGAKTTIHLLKDVSENIQIKDGRNVYLDLHNHKVSNSGNKNST